MGNHLLIVGGGIGGLATALASARAGFTAALFEQASHFAEVGAGIQMGPNVVRVLHAWGLQAKLLDVAARPSQLQVLHALQATVLATLPLDAVAQARYGAPYYTIARADLHQLLLQAVREQGAANLHLDARVVQVGQQADTAHLTTVLDESYQGTLLVGADGVWSRVRALVWDDGVAQPTGHLAFRAMVPQASLPQALRSQQVTAWLGPRFHAVHYPVRAGEWLNVVCIVHGRVHGDPAHWDHSANASELRQRLQGACGPLRDLIEAIPDWRLWALSDRPPMRSADEQARGRIALLGDAAHPMRPYLAQGAGMAIEDAAALAAALQADPDTVRAVQSYAAQRWQRNARVQARSRRNGTIFHLQGALGLGRDWSLRLLGDRLVDVPWLYAGGPLPV